MNYVFCFVTRLFGARDLVLMKSNILIVYFIILLPVLLESIKYFPAFFLGLLHFTLLMQLCNPFWINFCEKQKVFIQVVFFVFGWPLVLASCAPLSHRLCKNPFVWGNFWVHLLFVWFGLVFFIYKSNSIFFLMSISVWYFACLTQTLSLKSNGSVAFL